VLPAAEVRVDVGVREISSSDKRDLAGGDSKSGSSRGDVVVSGSDDTGVKSRNSMETLCHFFSESRVGTVVSCESVRTIFGLRSCCGFDDAQNLASTVDPEGALVIIAFNICGNEKVSIIVCFQSRI
jgi:hypothetical protein